MKLSEYIIIILVIALCFGVVGSVVNDLETEYPDTDINTSWQNEYNYGGAVTNDTTLLQSMIQAMSDEETGWFLKALIGVAAIPVAVYTAIITMFYTMGYGVIILSSIATEIGLPQFVISLGITGLTVLIVWGLLSWYRRSKA